jgi:membrane protein
MDGPPSHRSLSSLRVMDARAISRDLWRRNALVEASAMAFSLFLASIPLMALSGIVLSHVLRDEAQALWLVSSLVELAPDEVRALVDGNVSRGADQSMAPLFLAGCLYLAAGAFHDAMTVFESAVGATPRRWLVKRAIAMGCVLVLLMLFAVAGWLVITVMSGPFLHFTRVVELARQAPPRLLAFALAAGVSLLLVSGFFRVAVREHGVLPPVVPGAFVTVAIGSLASLLFATYARVLADYAAFYGSLAAVTVFLVWLWLCCVALLVGGQVNAHLENKAVKKAAPVASEPERKVA